MNSRRAASSEVEQRWRSWTPADLELLRGAARDPDPEVAARASFALRRLDLLRRYGERLVVVETLIDALREPSQRVGYAGAVIPGGPILSCSGAMEELIELGPSIEPLVIEGMKIREVQAELAVVLASIGTSECISALIESLPDQPPTDPRSLQFLCVNYALWHLTGQQIGVRCYGAIAWSPDVKPAWQEWYAENGPYLISLPAGVSRDWDGGERRLGVDSEAKLAGVPTDAYRVQHPRRRFADIAVWRDDPAYERSLREYCLSTLLGLAWSDGPRSSVLCLGLIDDPRARAGLEKIRDQDLSGTLLAHDASWALDIVRERAAERAKRPPTETPSAQRMENLRAYLKSDRPSARVDAAETLWSLGCADGFQTLVDILSLPRASFENIDAVRRACDVLGRMGNRAAIPALRALRGADLNHLSLHPGEMSWPGRPDAVALARLGDDSALEVVESSLRAGDPTDMIGRWPAHSEVIDLRVKRLVPLLVPFLDAPGSEKRAYAAAAIIRLLDEGK